jgi:hypothetical protein
MVKPAEPALSSATVSVDAVRAMARVFGDLATSAELAEQAWDDPMFWLVDAPVAQRTQFIVIGNAINFRFWHLDGPQFVPEVGVLKGEEFRGAMYMWRRLRLALERGEVQLDAEWLAQVDDAQFHAAFTDDEGYLPLEPGMANRLKNLQDLGRGLLERWDGWFSNLLVACEGSLDRFAELSAQFRAFDDPLRKLTMLNAIMLQGSGLVAFNSSPWPAIDYHLVKQAVRQGLVDPPPDVADKLRSSELLTAEESLDLRERVLEALLEVAERSNVSTAVVDNLYWLNRRTCADVEPACSTCMFRSGCAQRTEFGLPLELTRYY